MKGIALNPNHVRAVLSYVTMVPFSTAGEIIDATELSKASVHRVLSNTPSIIRTSSRPPRYAIDPEVNTEIVESAIAASQISPNVNSPVGEWRDEQDALIKDVPSISVVISSIAEMLSAHPRSGILQQAVANASGFVSGEGPLDQEIHSEARQAITDLRTILYRAYRFLEDLDTNPQIDTPEGWSLYAE